MDIYYYRALSLWDTLHWSLVPLGMHGPDHFVSRLFLKVLFAVNSADRWSNISPPGQRGVHLLHATKTVGSPNLVFPSSNTIPLCMQLHQDALNHPCGTWRQQETNTSMSTFMLFGMSLTVVQESLVLCQHGENNNRITWSLMYTNIYTYYNRMSHSVYISEIVNKFEWNPVVTNWLPSTSKWRN